MRRPPAPRIERPRALTTPAGTVTWTSDRYDELPHDQVTCLTQRCDRRFYTGLETYHRQVARRIIAQDLDARLRPVCKRRPQSSSTGPTAWPTAGSGEAAHDMAVGHGRRRSLSRAQDHPAPAGTSVRGTDGDNRRTQALCNFANGSGVGVQLLGLLAGAYG
jgi:hypothetical protein